MKYSYNTILHTLTFTLCIFFTAHNQLAAMKRTIDQTAQATQPAFMNLPKDILLIIAAHNNTLYTLMLVCKKFSNQLGLGTWKSALSAHPNLVTNINRQRLYYHAIKKNKDVDIASLLKLDTKHKDNLQELSNNLPNFAYLMQYASANIGEALKPYICEKYFHPNGQNDLFLDTFITIIMSNDIDDMIKFFKKSYRESGVTFCEKIKKTGASDTKAFWADKYASLAMQMTVQEALDNPTIYRRSIGV